MEDLIVIHFERTGGFTGITLDYTANLMNLEPDKVKEIIDLVLGSGLSEEKEYQDHFHFSLKNGKGSVRHPPDRFTYNIIIETEISIKKYCLHDTEIPDRMWPLIRYLTNMARKNH